MSSVSLQDEFPPSCPPAPEVVLIHSSEVGEDPYRVELLPSSSHNEESQDLLADSVLSSQENFKAFISYEDGHVEPLTDGRALDNFKPTKIVVPQLEEEVAMVYIDKTLKENKVFVPKNIKRSPPRRTFYDANDNVIEEDTSETILCDDILEKNAGKSEYKYKCKYRYCGYSTNRKSNFYRHERSMHKIPLDIMTVKPSKNNANAHLNTVCCGTDFKFKARLALHRQQCHAEGYKCEYCNKVFQRKALFVRHMRYHEGIKELKCAICGYQTNHKANFKRHCNAVHGNFKSHGKKSRKIERKLKLPEPEIVLVQEPILSQNSVEEVLPSSQHSIEDIEIDENMDSLDTPNEQDATLDELLSSTNIPSCYLSDSSNLEAIIVNQFNFDTSLNEISWDLA